MVHGNIVRDKPGGSNRDNSKQNALPPRDPGDSKKRPPDDPGDGESGAGSGDGGDGPGNVSIDTEPGGEDPEDYDPSDLDFPHPAYFKDKDNNWRCNLMFWLTPDMVAAYNDKLKERNNKHTTNQVYDGRQYRDSIGESDSISCILF